MKGTIYYREKSRSAKAMAQAIMARLKGDFNIEIKALGTKTRVNEDDFFLIGGPIHKGKLPEDCIHLLDQVTNRPVGLFATAGLAYMANFKDQYQAYLDGLLVGKASLGTFVLPGSVDHDWYKSIRLVPNFILNNRLAQTRDSKTRHLSIKEQMIQGFDGARPASSEELAQAGDYFYKKLTDMDLHK